MRKGCGALSERTSQPRHGAPVVTMTAVDTQCRVCPGIPREEGHPPSYPGCSAGYFGGGAERGPHLERGAAWCPGVQIRTGFDVILDHLGSVTGRIPPPPKKYLVSNPQNLRATLWGGNDFTDRISGPDLEKMGRVSDYPQGISLIPQALKSRELSLVEAEVRFKA